MPGSNDRSERWAGGFVRITGEGPTRQRVYVIRKQVGGERYEVSTRKTSEEDALLELLKFNRSPATYDPTPPPDLVGDEGPQPVYLTAALIKEYLDHCTKAGNTHQWWNSKRRFLGWWLVKLHGVDLRRADLRLHILDPLEGATSRPQRIATIKHLYAWLRDADGGKGILSPGEDPILGRLAVPQSQPGDDEGKSRVFSVTDLNKVKKELAHGPGWRLDAIDVLTATGWHYAELCRFAEGEGGIELLPAPKERKATGTGKKGPTGKKKSASGRAVAVLTTRMLKGRRPGSDGAVHKTAVSAKVLAAAKRIRDLGHLPEFHLHLVLREISRKLKLKVPVAPGAFRHTVATWAVKRGSPMDEVATFLGHRTLQTTKRFYAKFATPKKVWTLT